MEKKLNFLNFKLLAERPAIFYFLVAVWVYALHFGMLGTQAYGGQAWYGQTPQGIPGGVWLLENWYPANGDTSNTIELSETMRGIWMWEFSKANTMLPTPMYQFLLACLEPFLGIVIGFTALNILLFFGSGMLLYRLIQCWLPGDKETAFLAGLILLTFPGMVIELTEPIYYVFSLFNFLLVLYAYEKINQKHLRSPDYKTVAGFGMLLALAKLTYPGFWIFVFLLWLSKSWGIRKALLAGGVSIVIEIFWSRFLILRLFPNTISLATTAAERISASLRGFMMSGDLENMFQRFSEIAGRNVTSMIYSFFPHVFFLFLAGVILMVRDRKIQISYHLLWAAATFIPLVGMQVAVSYYIGHLYFYIVPTVLMAAAYGVVCFKKKILAWGESRLPFSKTLAHAWIGIFMILSLLTPNLDTLFGLYRPYLLNRYGPLYWRSNADLNYCFNDKLELRYRTNPENEAALYDKKFWKDSAKQTKQNISRLIAGER